MIFGDPFATAAYGVRVCIPDGLSGRPAQGPAGKKPNG